MADERANGTGTTAPRRGRRSRLALEGCVTKMLERAAALEADARDCHGIPLAQEAYSEAVAILRDAADRIQRPLGD